MKRRSSGDGSVFRIESGRDAGKWCAQVDLGWTPRGTRNRPRRIRATEREAKSALKELLELREAGVTRIETVHQWLNYWLEHVVAPESAPNTLRAYTTALDMWVKPGISPHVMLIALDARHLRQMQATMRAKGASPNRVWYATNVLGIALNAAVKDRLLPRSPVAPLLAAMTKPEATPRAALTWAEATALLDATTDLRHRAWFACSFMSGLRPSEVLGIRRQDVDLTCDDTSVWRGMLRVRGQIGRFGDETGMYVKTKTARSVRDVPLEPIAAATIAAWLDAAPDSPWLFPGRRPSEPMVYETYRVQWKAALAAGGARVISPHGARATFGTRLLDCGVSPAVAGKILGDRPETLLKHYARSSEATERAAMKALEG